MKAETSRTVEFPKSRRATFDIGEILHLTVLVDHDAVDGAPMARFIGALTKNIENGIGL